MLFELTLTKALDVGLDVIFTTYLIFQRRCKNDIHRKEKTVHPKQPFTINQSVY